MRLNIPRKISNWEIYKKIKVDKSTVNFVENTAGNGRRFATYDDYPYWAEAFAEFGLKPDSVEPMFKTMLGNNYKDGAYVHEHTDPAPEGYVHTRCNLMLEKPRIGGNPVLDGEELDVEVGDLWLCLASLETHGTTPISGGERLILSYGGLVPKSQIDKIIGR